MYFGQCIKGQNCRLEGNACQSLLFGHHLVRSGECEFYPGTGQSGKIDWKKKRDHAIKHWRAQSYLILLRDGAEKLT